MRADNLVGQTFGRLTVIKQIESDKRKKARWLCHCECGNEVKVTGSNLRHRGTKSCGCLQREAAKIVMLRNHNVKDVGEASFNHLFSGYKADAKRREYPFELSKEKFRELTQQNCFYCGNPPNRRITAKTYNGDYICNGIDRVDNSKGYVEGNVVSCCKECNTLKGGITLKMIEKINLFMSSQQFVQSKFLI